MRKKICLLSLIAILSGPLSAHDSSLNEAMKVDNDTLTFSGTSGRLYTIPRFSIKRLDGDIITYKYIIPHDLRILQMYANCKMGSFRYINLTPIVLNWHAYTLTREAHFEPGSVGEESMKYVCFIAGNETWAE